MSFREHPPTSQAVQDSFAGTRQPTAEQVSAIQEFLEKQKKSGKYALYSVSGNMFFLGARCHGPQKLIGQADREKTGDLESRYAPRPVYPRKVEPKDADRFKRRYASNRLPEVEEIERSQFGGRKQIDEP